METVAAILIFLLIVLYILLTLNLFKDENRD